MPVRRRERASDAGSSRGTVATTMWARGAPPWWLTLFAMRSLVAAGGLVLAISGCTETSQTAVVIDVLAEQAVVDQAEDLRLRVVEDRAGVEAVVFDEVRSRPSWPVRHVVLGRGGEALRVEALAIRGGVEASATSALVRMEAGRSVWLPLTLSARCWGAACATTESCEPTGCTPTPSPMLPGPPPRRPSNDIDAGQTDIDAGQDGCGGRLDGGPGCVVDADAGGAGDEVVEIAAGREHTCARRSDGTVLCWGKNSFGQLGDGTTNNRLRPTVVAGLTDVVQLSAGGDHTCARLGSGEVMCWGRNDGFQLANGGTARSASPTAVLGLVDAVEVAAGELHTCARRRSGGVVCWGKNSAGQGGVEGATNLSSPTPVQRADGEPLMGAVELAAGSSHTCARIEDGSVLCWGSRDSSQLGFEVMMGTTPPSTLLPLTPVSGLRGALEVAAGQDHTCARSSTSLVCWGVNAYGQLGSGDSTPYTTPVAVELANPLGLSAGRFHTCALASEGPVFCWGSNALGQVGAAGTGVLPNPTEVAGLSGVVALTLGADHSCALSIEGVRCWGRNDSGQLGNGTANDSAVPVTVHEL